MLYSSLEHKPFPFYTAFCMKTKYQIIYLNGPSSCGKSTLSKALQEALDPPFLHIGIDKVIGMMPRKLNWESDPPSKGFSFKAAYDEKGILMQELQIGPFGKQILQAYEEIVVTLTKLKHFLIVDDIGLGKAEVDRWKKLLKDYQVLYVGLFASLETLEKREQARGDRMQGSARAQLKKIHKGVSYDLEIDTEKNSLEQNIQEILSFLK